MNPMPIFIATKSEIAALAAKLRLLRKEEWCSVYVDPATSEQWTRFPMWDYHGPGPECFRRGTPTITQTLEAIEFARTDAEVAAATLYAVHELSEGKENLLPLVKHLEQLLQRDKNAFSRKVALAVTWSHAANAFNHRNPVGKGINEVSADYEHFKSLALRATALKASAEELCGEVTQDSAVFQ
jgi:hypothetical protein